MIPRRVIAPLAIVLVLVFTNLQSASAKLAPGDLPQTSIEPSLGAGLTDQMRLLWHAIEVDSPALGARIFFPEAAYVRMKTGMIAYPASDYSGRLAAFFDLDVHAYHQLLSTHGTSTLLHVVTSPSLATWIAPGACENKVGYWHLPGVRLVLKQRRQVVSVSVASLISWRGVWYVVHLGPNPRTHNVGTVDGYRLGAGTPGPPGGC